MTLSKQRQLWCFYETDWQIESGVDMRNPSQKFYIQKQLDYICDFNRWNRYKGYVTKEPNFENVNLLPLFRQDVPVFDSLI